MKKYLLLVAGLTISLLASATLPTNYQYFSFKKNDGVTPAYVVPDPSISSATTLNAVTSGANTQGLGLQCINFDQASSTEASSYVGDYNKTCGLTPSAFAETATNSAIRGWVVDEVSPFVAGSIYSTKNEPCLGFNASPQTFRFSGGWYYYTVNFTEATEYEFYLRIRSGNMRVNKLVGGVSQSVDKIVTVQIYDKTNMATPLKTWTLNYGGINVSANPPSATLSTDESVSYICWAKGSGTPFVGTAGQSGSFWSKAKDTYTIPGTGEYVIKITDPTLKVEGQDAASGASDSNNAIGSFTFIKKSVTTDIKQNNINAFVVLEGQNLKLEGDVLSAEVYTSLGKLVAAQNNFKSTIKVSNNGVYIVKMTTPSGVKTQKVIVK